MIHNEVGDKRWFGWVRRKLMNELMRWVEKIEEVCSKIDKGILKKKNWWRSLGHDMRFIGLAKDMIIDRDDWRAGIHVANFT